MRRPKCPRPFLIGLLLSLAHATSHAQESPAPPLVPSEAESPATEANPPAPNPKTIQRLQDEITVLRLELQRLNDMVETYLGSMVSQLQEENTLLREELRRLYNAPRSTPPPNIPRPGGALFRELQSEGEFTEGEYPIEEAWTEPGPLPDSPLVPSPPPPAEFSFEIVNEWGRSPEAAAALNNGTASLIGIVGVVPPGSTDEDIKALGRELRARYDDYENINIEVYDSRGAAAEYLAHGATNPVHRVLSVSKYPEGDRDMILLLRNGEATEVPMDGE